MGNEADKEGGWGMHAIGDKSVNMNLFNDLLMHRCSKINVLSSVAAVQIGSCSKTSSACGISFCDTRFQKLRKSFTTLFVDSSCQSYRSRWFIGFSFRGYEPPELTRFKKMVARKEPGRDCLMVLSSPTTVAQTLLGDFKDTKGLIEYLLNAEVACKSLWRAIHKAIDFVWYDLIQFVTWKNTAGQEVVVPTVPKKDTATVVKKPESVKVIAKHAVQRHNYQLLI